MLSLATREIISLSLKPLNFIMYIYMFMIIIIFVLALIFPSLGIDSNKWLILNFSIWGVGGLITFSVGIVGRYISSIHLETKHRPKFIIDTFLYEEDKER